jgi:hypothetical protein
VADYSSAPLHRLGYGQPFLGDHPLQRSTGTVLSGGNRGIAFSERRQHL